jgi:RNA polymerase sigma-70 factor, ECF subfamily
MQANSPVKVHAAEHRLAAASTRRTHVTHLAAADTSARRDGRRGLAAQSPARSDENLLADYVATGNPQAFEELVGRYQRELYSYLRQHLGDAQLAEDAFQATFLQVHLKCAQFKSGCRLRPWLYTIANHQAIDLQRKNRRHKAVSLSTAVDDSDPEHQRQPLGGLLVAADADPSQRLRRAEDCQRTRRAVMKVPVKVRQVLNLLVYEGLPYQEVADTLGIPLGTVKSRMNKALRSFHEALVATKRPASQEV